MARRASSFTCPYCGAAVPDVPFGEKPHITVLSEKGGRMLRILRYEGEELHRCEESAS